jgi:hypothetical protein
VRPLPSAGGPIFAQLTQVGGEVRRRSQGAGVVLALHPPPARQDVFAQFAGGLMVAELAQVGGDAVRRVQGAGVVLALHPPPAGQSVLVQFAGGLTLS